MKKLTWIGIGLMLAAVPLATALEGGADRAPVQKWAACYNGPGNGDDSAAAMVLDASGNIYVVGTSLGSGTGTDITVVKFDASGKQLWAKSHDGPAHGDDAAKDIAVDAAGNVFVLGTTKAAKGIDITTVKYSPAGKRIWVRTYDGQGHRDDEAGGIAVDGEGAAIVCGFGRGTVGPHFALIKYGAKGASMWIKNSIEKPTDIAMARDVVVDASNNIYVCGGLFNGNWDLLAVKFDKNGSRLWSKTVNCTGDDTDVAAAICVTPSGAVTIAGSSKRTAYNHDIVTAKFDKDGRHLWLKAFNGRKNGDDGLGGLALDAKGNAYVTGWTTVAAVDWDFATMKYGPSGKTLWTKTYHGPTEGDYGRTIALDRSGNAYVVGESRNERGNDDITTLKYDPAGKARWGLRYDGPGLVDDIPSAIVLDAAGNIFIAGTCGGSGTGTDFVLIKY